MSSDDAAVINSNINHDNTYKQTEGRNQPMQLDLSKVLSRSTLTPTPKVGGRSRKGFVCWLCIFKDWVSNIYSPTTSKKGNLDSNFLFATKPDTSSCILPWFDIPDWLFSSALLFSRSTIRPFFLSTKHAHKQFLVSPKFGINRTI